MRRPTDGSVVLRYGDRAGLRPLRRRTGLLRVLLVDDHAVFRRGLRSVIDIEEDMAVAGEAGSVAELVRLGPAAGRVDVALVDVRLPDGPKAGQTVKTTLFPITMDGQRLGVRHYIKKDLQPHLPKDYPNPLRVPQHH